MLFIDIIALVILVVAGIVFIISTCIYKAVKKMQNEDKRKAFFFRFYLVSVGMIIFGLVCNWLLEPPQMGVYGYLIMAFFVTAIGFGMTACITFAIIAHKVIGLMTRNK